MPKFPEPPSASVLAATAAITETLQEGFPLWRIYFRSGMYPVEWNTFRNYGPTSSRFDHHVLPRRVQNRAILYGSKEGPTCFAEVFQDKRTIDTRTGDPWLVCFALARSVQLLDLSSNWTTQAGASMAINSGPRPRARRWSQTIYQAYPSIEGLWYCSSMDGNRPAAALYERAQSTLPSRPVFNRALADPAMARIIARIALRFGFDIV